LGKTGVWKKGNLCLVIDIIGGNKVDVQGIIQTILIILLLGLLIWDLRRNIVNQNTFLQIMDNRVIETRKISELYQNLLYDLPNYIEKFSEGMQGTKERITQELDKASATKDEDLKKLKQKQLEELETKENLVKGLPKLVQKLIETLSAVDQRLILMGLPARGISIYDAMIRGYNKRALLDIESILKSADKESEAEKVM